VRADQHGALAHLERRARVGAGLHHHANRSRGGAEQTGVERVGARPLGSRCCEVGLLDEDWTASWISPVESADAGYGKRPAHLLRTEFSLTGEVRSAQPREAARWPGFTTPRGGYQGEINSLKTWLTRRLDFMDTNFLAPPSLNLQAGTVPPGWPGWPEGKRFGLVLTHDVESQKGLNRCRQLMELEMRSGVRSSFNFVPEGDYSNSKELRDLLTSTEPSARLAVDYFVYRAAREIGGLAAVLGGVDALVFTAGIGENSPEIRSRICRSSSWLGIDIDPAANTNKGPRLSRPTSRVSAWVIPTNEELMIARHTSALLGLVEARA
jgi:hypothetical protein